MKITKRSSNSIDQHVGEKLKTRRNLLGLSQEDLANQVDLTYQQIQKYERGTNRIGASRLFEFSRVLHVAVGYFFEGLENVKKGKRGFAEKKQASFKMDGEDIMGKKETYNLIRAYYKIKDPKLRQQILEMTKAMGRSSR